MIDSTPTAPYPEGAAQRLHALDNLRALVMWLGIVLHVAVIYTVYPSPLPWRDEQRTFFADLLSFFIHAFRMPVFFILAGFFAAMLLRSRGAAGMLKNRLLRLGAPFAVFWPPVFAATVVFALLFMHRMARGTWGIDATLMPHSPTVPQGPSTLHMWFLWMLLWFCVATAALDRLGGEALRRPAAAVATRVARIGAAGWGFAALALPLGAVGALYPNGIVTVNGAFLPPPAEWVHNGVFYLFGLCLYSQRESLFVLFARRAWGYGAAGLVFFAAAFVLVGVLLERPAGTLPFNAFWIALTYNCASWLWSFALIGLALRYLPRHNAVLAYLADSSYWVYLVHLPATIGFGALMYGLAWPALAKIGLNIAATTLLCLATYQLFVRFTFVSRLLNGKRHVRTAHAGLPRGATS
jgi:glucans biosynthesis protein C